MKPKIHIYIIFILFVFGILIFLSGRKAASTELKAMSDSVAATAQLTTGQEVGREYQERVTKPLLGKPKQPQVRIEYQPINSYTKEDVYKEIIKVLEANDWERIELSTPQSGYYKASMPGAGFLILAEVLIHSMTNTVSITLTTVPG